MIVQMKRLTLVAHKADEQAIMQALQPLGAVEVLRNENASFDAEQLNAAEERVQRLGEALKILKPYGAKKGLLTPRPEATLLQIMEEVPDALQHSTELDQYQRELSRLHSEMEKNASTIESLLPWDDFPADMQDYKKSKAIRYFPGMLAEADLPRLDEQSDAIEYQLFGDGAVRPVMVACAAADAKSIGNFLKSLNWTDFAFPKLPGTPREAIVRLQKENAALHQELERLTQQLAAKGVYQDAIAGAYDAAVIERDRLEAIASVAQTTSTFELEGWVPEDRVADVEKAVSSVTDAYYFAVRDPNEDEIPPSVVRNNRFAQPFEEVTNLYSRPDPYGIDATPYMAPWYVLLFGLMLSDTGYGILLTLGCWLYCKIKKPSGMSGGIARVLFWGGISTIVWGVLTGTFFGVDFDTIFGTPDLFPILVDPMTDPIMMLVLCFGLGVLHILCGLGLKIKMSFARGDWQTAVFDNLSWILIIVGFILFAVPMVAAGLPAAIGTAGLAMVIAGVALILLFKGRAKKNVFSRTVSGLGELYQVTSYLSDILSYARLFALGIATGVIASVFNDLCSMLTGSPYILLKIVGILIAVALLIALHLFNLAINTLGAFVHCARLQYVEFYGKFYETGGVMFKPLGYNTRHVRLTDKAS